MNKLSNVVKNEVVKKTVYNELVAQVNNIDISGFVLKLNSVQIKQIEKKIPDTSKFVKKSDCNAKVSELEKNPKY